MFRNKFQENSSFMKNTRFYGPNFMNRAKKKTKIITLF